MPKIDYIANEYLRCRNLLLKVVANIVPQKDVEDIVQDVYIRACQSGVDISKPRPYMVQTAKNLALDYLRSARVRLVIDDYDLPSILSEGDQTIEEASSQRKYSLFCEVVNQIPEQSKQAFILKKVYGFTQKEIAQKMDITESTVEKHIASGLSRCLTLMQGPGGKS